jgi:hypothetical protein
MRIFAAMYAQIMILQEKLLYTINAQCTECWDSFGCLMNFQRKASAVDAISMSIRGPASELRRVPDHNGNSWEPRRVSARVVWYVFTADGKRISGIPVAVSAEGIRFNLEFVPFFKTDKGKQIEWVKQIKDAAGLVLYEEQNPPLLRLVVGEDPLRHAMRNGTVQAATQMSLRSVS